MLSLNTSTADHLTVKVLTAATEPHAAKLDIDLSKDSRIFLTANESLISLTSVYQTENDELAN